MRAPQPERDPFATLYKGSVLLVAINSWTTMFVMKKDMSDGKLCKELGQQYLKFGTQYCGF